MASTKNEGFSQSPNAFASIHQSMSMIIVGARLEDRTCMSEKSLEPKSPPPKRIRWLTPEMASVLPDETIATKCNSSEGICVRSTSTNH